MRINAKAKINLSLDVTGKLPNGYHTVSMIMQEIGLCDVIDIELTNEKGIALTAEGMDLPCDRKNIAYRAAESFFEKTSYEGGCSIHIKKNIPSCAGLGGGSSDGAAVLKGLNELCSKPLEKAELMELGLSLGADVPFCIMGGTALAEGIGEVLTPIDSKLKCYAAVIKPPINISTPEAYKAIDSADFPHPDTQRCIDALILGRGEMLSEFSSNAFEYVCCPVHKEIDLIKKHLVSKGAFFSMMSGSGSAVYGLFEKLSEAREAYESYPYEADGGVCEL